MVTPQTGCSMFKRGVFFQFQVQGLRIAHIPIATATGNALQTYRETCPASYALLT